MENANSIELRTLRGRREMALRRIELWETRASELGTGIEADTLRWCAGRMRVALGLDLPESESKDLYYVTCHEAEDDVYHVVSATYKTIHAGGTLPALCGALVFVDGFAGVGIEVESDGGFCGECQTALENAPPMATHSSPVSIPESPARLG